MLDLVLLVHPVLEGADVVTQILVLAEPTTAVDAVTEALLSIAKSANVPVVEFTETLPAGQNSYIDWQQKQIAALASALPA